MRHTATAFRMCMSMWCRSNWNEPFDDKLPKKLLSDEEYAQMVADLRAQLNA